jgi:hypothetical protein
VPTKPARRYAVSEAAQRPREELQAEAGSKGWGKMYAAMGGGRDGLWACAAIEKLCEVRGGAIGALRRAICAAPNLPACLALPCQTVWQRLQPAPFAAPGAGRALPPDQGSRPGSSNTLCRPAAQNKPLNQTNRRQVSAIDKLLSAFIVPLQSDDISTTLPNSLGLPATRVHCSLNLNTETGRLSARRPNLQNQPALEKDRYKVCQGAQARAASPAAALPAAVLLHKRVGVFVRAGRPSRL